MAWMDNFISGDDFDSIRLGVASREDILNWSFGEVTRPETINYRTQKPERDGLFCERIFGPVKDINPHDSKLKGVRSREAAVDKEGNLVTRSIARRERMGHIELAVPVAHIWFMRGVPSALALLLDMTVKNIERVVYFSCYMVTNVETDKVDQILADLEAETTAARQAIQLRYEQAATAENADVKALAEAQTKEIEELEETYADKKSRLESLVKGAILSEVDYRSLPDEYADLISVGMGAGTIKSVLEEIDLPQLIADLQAEAAEAKGQKAKKLIKRLKTLEGMESAGVKPTDLILTVVPVIPPDLRPMISLEGGRFATSDLNDLYRSIINRNNRLKKLMSLNAPDVICRNEMRMLQEAVDALIDGPAAAKTGRGSTGPRGRRKSLSETLKGKQGRFRQNLLGKRVDYSGRSVVVIGPELKMDECGLPKIIALELFKPFVISWIIAHDEKKSNPRTAAHAIEERDPIIWDALDEVIKEKYILLNRAPSLHRLSIQAFKPKLIDGKAIQLHPLVLKGFNADFDGDQMAIHLPLSNEAQAEARELITVQHNLLKPADGIPILNIAQDAVLGNYYLTYDKPSLRDQQPKVFTSVYEAEIAYDHGLIKLQSPIRVFAKREIRNTTLGRIFFNDLLPKDYPYNNNPQTAKELKRVMASILELYGPEKTVEIADAIKDLSFKYETIASISIARDDYPTIPEVSSLIAEGDAKVAVIADQFNQGMLTEEERYQLTIENWHDVDSKIEKTLKQYMEDVESNSSIMINSGARGSISNIKQASAAIGIQVDVSNREIELPVKSSYKEGLNTLESFVATRGARQGQVSTALRTADSGYLTRRLVDVSQDVFTIDGDYADPGFEVFRSEATEMGVTFASRIFGRYTAAEVPGHIAADQLITREAANGIEADESIQSVRIQSILTTTAQHGIPRKAYGIDLATSVIVEPDQPVGVIAAQSVGEPGTQLTLDTKHSSGASGSGAISRGLPRVEELLEARIPKGQAYISPIDGLVEVEERADRRVVRILPQSGKLERIKLTKGEQPTVKDGAAVKLGDVIASLDKGKSPVVAPFDGVVEIEPGEIIIASKNEPPIKVDVPTSFQIFVKSGDAVTAGDRLSEGSLNLQDLMKYKGIEATERYILNEIMAIYAAQGQEISNKHLEIVVRQMFSRAMVNDGGDSNFIAGSTVSIAAILRENERLSAEGKQLIDFTQQLLGITKVSIWSDSFLSAASFQDTTRVLISSAISGRVDELKGLKENVIIGRKIPVGTGIRPLAIPEPELDNSVNIE
jgi:DNA-directed RNA polymerase subunit beta'